MKKLFKYCITCILLLFVTHSLWGQVNIAGPDTICIGSVESFSASGGSSYTWTAQPGGLIPTSSGSTVNFNFPSVNTYTVVVTAYNSMGAQVGTDSSLVAVLAQPDPIINILSAVECTNIVPDTIIEGDKPREPLDTCYQFCEAAFVDFSAAPHANAVYTWQAPGADSIFVSGLNATVQWQQPGSGYLLILTEEDTITGCTNSYELCVEIVARPDAAFSSFPQAVNDTIHICLAQSINFIDVSDVSVSSISEYFWDFGDGTTSSQQNPKHFFLSDGTFNVQLITSNLCSCSDTSTVTVVVDAQPGLRIECPTTLCSFDTTTYWTPDSSSCSQLLWSVTGGTIIGDATQGTVQVVWGDGNSGPGVICLEPISCSNTCSSPTCELVPLVAQAAAINGPTLVCPGDISIYSVPNVPSTNYTWSVTGDEFSINQGNTILVKWTNQAGTGTVSVDYENTFYDCNGSSFININKRPPFSIGGSNKVCTGVNQGLYYVVSSDVTQASSINWELTYNGQVVDSDVGSPVSFDFAQPGIYVLTATDPSGFYCTPNNQLVITALQTPGTPIVSGISCICPGELTTYSAVPSTPGNYIQWNFLTFVDQQSANGNNVSIVWDEDIINYYSIQVIEMTANGFCSNSVSFDTVKCPIDTPVFMGRDTVCINDTSKYTTAISASEYSWSISPQTAGTIISGSGTGEIIIEWHATSMNVQLTLTQLQCGTYISYTKDIFIRNAPDPEIIYSDTICVETTDALFTAIGGVSTSHYVWTIDGVDQNIDDDELITNFPVAGTYTVGVSISDINNCGITKSTVVLVDVLPLPIGFLSTPDSTVFCTNPVNTTLYVTVQDAAFINSTYTWYLDGNEIAGVTADTLHVDTAGMYQVLISSPNGCSVLTNRIFVIDSCVADTFCVFLPGSDIAIDSVQHDCENFTFYGSGSANLDQLFWYSAGDFLGSGAVVNYSYEKAGYYSYQLIGTFVDDTCELKTSGSLVVPFVPDFLALYECDSSGSGIRTNLKDISSYVSPYDITSWEWVIDGVFAANTQDYSANLSPGDHIVSLTISDGVTDTCTFTDTITVPAQPTASFTVSSGPYCENDPILFTNTSAPSSDIIGYSWDFNDGSYSNLENPSREFISRSLPYLPSLIITDIYGCMDTAIGSPVVVNQNPFGIVRATPANTVLCPGEDVLLSVTNLPTLGTFSYSWSNGNTTATQTVSAADSYTVTVTDQGGCSVVSTPAIVTISQVPFPEILGRKRYCLGESPFLYTSVRGAYNYKWYVNGFFISTFGGPEYTPGAFSTGTYEIGLEIIDAYSGCSNYGEVTIVINALPDMPSVAVVLPACLGDGPVLISASHNDPASIVNYQWSTGDNGDTIAVNSPGIYEVVAVDTNGCISDPNFIEVQPPIDFTQLLTGCIEICDTQYAVIDLPDQQDVVYSWLRNGVLYEAEAAGDLVLVESGSYQLVGRNIENGCRDTSDVINVNILTCEIPCCDNMDGFFQDLAFTGVGQNGPVLDIVINIDFQRPGPVPFTAEVEIDDLGILILDQNSFNQGSNLITGTFTVTSQNPPPITHFCVKFLIPDPDGIDSICHYTVCRVVDDIGCNLELVAPSQDSCMGTNANGDPIYFMDLWYEYYGSPGSLIAINSPNTGTFTGFNTNNLNPGLNNIQVTYTDIPPYDNGTANVNLVVIDPLGGTCRVDVTFMFDYPCPPDTICDLVVDELTATCLKSSFGDGYVDYSISTDIAFSGTPGSTLDIIPSHGTSASSTYTLSGSTQNFQFTFTDSLPINGEVCFDYVVTDTVFGTCTTTACVILPIQQCISDTCSRENSLTSVTCLSPDSNGNDRVRFNVFYTNATGVSGLQVVSNAGPIGSLGYSYTQGPGVTLNAPVTITENVDPICIYILDVANNCIDSFCVDNPCDTSGSALLKFAPNPAQNQTTISYHLPEQDGNSIMVTDLYGNSIEKLSLENGSGQFQYYTGNLSDGVYIIYLLNNNKVRKTGKLVVIK